MRRKSKWVASSLWGSPKRFMGILHNELYIGRRAWNRFTWIRSAADSSKRRIVLNPEAKWIVHEREDLRIVSQKLWDRVRLRHSEQSKSIGYEFGCVRLEQSGVEHLLVILPEGFKGFSGRYQTEGSFDCISIVNQLSGLIVLSKEMLFVSGDIFSQVSVIDRFRRYASSIEAIKIVPVTRLAITTPECAS